MRFVIFCIVCTVQSFCVAVMAQELTQTLRGRVIDKDTKVSLPGANVVVTGTEPLKGTMTDAEGYYRITGVPVGKQTIRCSFMGYEDFVVAEIEISSVRETMLNIELKPTVLQSEEVVITANYVKQDALNDMALVSTRSFSVEETGRYAASWGDPSRMAANFAGVSIVSDKRNDIIVRGNSPMSVLWKLDGVDIPNPNHFAVAGSSGGAISMINNNLLDNSDFHTGAFAPEYSNALAAVFDLRMRNGNNEKREYLFQAGVNGFEGGAEGPFIKGKSASYLINYRYSTLTLLDKAGISIIEAIPNFQDLSFKCHLPMKKGFVSLFGIGGLSMADYKPEKSAAFLADSRNRWGYRSGTRMGVGALTFQHLLGNKTYLRLSVSASAYNPTDKSDSTGLGFVVYDKYESAYTEYRKTFTVLLNSKLSRFDIIRYGGAYSHISSINDSYFFEYLPQAHKNIVSDTKGTYGLAHAYVQWLHQRPCGLTFSAGLNTQYLELNGKTSIEPRAGLSWRPDDRHMFTAGFGLHSQTQASAVYFLEYKDTTGHVTYPGKNLGFSESLHYVGGYQYRFNTHIRLKTEVYYQDLRHIPVSHSDPYFSLINFATDDNIFRHSGLTADGRGRNYGIEATFERFLNKGYYYLLTATLYESQFKDGTGEWRSTRFNSNTLLSVLAGKDFEHLLHKNSVLGLHVRFTHIGGQRYTPIDLDASRLAGSAVYIDSLAFSEQFEPFIKCDVRLRYRVNFRKVAGELAFDVTNIFNRKNVESRNYDPYLQDIRYVYNLSRIPVVFLRVEF